MGTVWRARQEEPIEREVAIKIIKLGMDTRALLSRFEAERQALAALAHPGIAKVFDGGTSASGQPYYVMELIAGLPVTEFCRAEGLSLDERLQLFKRVCQVVGYAHDEGIVHRDLKPSNVLAHRPEPDAEPAVKLIDFGIAKAVGGSFAERTLCTGEGQVIGTPGYMSPEQADGAPGIDGRADVYSLGALLYEMLSGEAPFDEETLREAELTEVIRIIREEEPPRPSTRLQMAPGRTAAATLSIAEDLDWIALKALAKEPSQRYQSAADLAGDIERHLRGERVSAGPPSLVFRLRKWLASHPMAALALCGALAVTLSIFFATRAGDRPDEGGGDGIETEEGVVDLRALARWVFERNGSIWHREEPGRKRTIREIAELPEEPLDITSVWVGNLDDDDLARLASWVAEIPTCGRLGISGPELTDASMAKLSGLQQITNLGIGAPAVTAEGLADLKDLPNLEMLNLDNAHFGREGLAHIRDNLPSIGWLLLTTYEVRAGDLTPISEMPNLYSLDLNLDRGSAEILRPVTRSRLRYVSLRSAQSWVPELAADFAKMASLEALHLDDCTSFDEGALAVLGGSASLRELRLLGTVSVGAPALAAFCKAHPGITVMLGQPMSNAPELQGLKNITTWPSAVTVSAPR